MKAISLTQPWATLVAIEAKQIETRSWWTTYRGTLAIHASKIFPRWAVELGIEEPFRSALIAGGFTKLAELPLGAIVAVSVLEHVGTINGSPERGVTITRVVDEGLFERLPVPVEELPFGDYSTGRQGWILSKTQRLPEPISCKGALCLWGVPAEIEARIMEQVEL